MSMSRSQLAKLMLQYEEAKREADRLAELITQEVLDIGETVDVGNVRATYNSGRREFDYELAAAHAIVSGKVPPDEEAKYTVIKVDWRRLCQDNDLDDIPVTKQHPPNVRLKFTD